MCLVFLAILTVGNLRGIRESGNIFAVPTYFFVVSIALLLAAGLYRYLTGGIVPVDAPLPPNAGQQPLTTFLLLTAFANGCTAMTGVEAVSNGVPAFRPPEAKNASATLIAMATFWRSRCSSASPCWRTPTRWCRTRAESGVSQLGRAIFGGPNILYYLLQAGTTLILVLAANTAYADFPRLASIVVARPLPAAPVHEPGRPPGVLERHPGAVGLRGDPDRRLPRRHAVAAAALHDRRVRLVHAVAGRHGDPLARSQGAGLEDQRRRSTASARWSPASS